MKKVVKGLSLFLMAALLVQVAAPAVFGIGGGDGEVTVPILDDGNGIACDEFDFSEPPGYNKEETELSPIVGEDSSLRNDANTRHYRLENGTYVAASYSSPVNYEEDGVWKDIDNTLSLSNERLSATGKAAYAPNANAFPVSIPQDFAGGQKITLENKGHAVGFGVSANNADVSLQSEAVLTDVEALPSAALSADSIAAEDAEIPDGNLTKAERIKKQNGEIMKLDNQESAVVYKDVLPGTDFEYILSSTGLKENIVVNYAQNSYIYNFDIDLAGLVPVPQESGSIWLVEENNVEEPVFILPAPYMYDAGGEECFDAAMKIEGGTLTVEADANWINDAERVWPVCIDPSIFVLNDSATVQDTYVNSSWLAPNANYSGSANLYAGKRTTGSVDRTYIKFMLPSLPADRLITYAQFTLKEWNPLSHYPILIYDCSYYYSNWAHSAISWNNQPLSKNDNGLKTQANLPMITDTAGLMPGDAYYDINITEEVERWYQSGKNGLAITSVDETKSGQIEMHSSRTSNANKRPALMVYYVNTKELDDLYTRETIDLGRSGAVTVNQLNGRMAYAHSDLSMNGNRMPISISHIFRPTAANDGGKQANMYFGNGFNLNIVEKIREIENTESIYNDGYRYEYITSAGSSYYFLSSAVANKFVYEYSVNDPGSSTQVSYSSWFITKSFNTLTMEDNQGNKKVFINVLVSEPQISRLIKIEDANGNEQNINYSSGKITSVTDGAGRQAKLYYDANGYLTEMRDPSKRMTNFYYSFGGNNLTGIIYPDGKYTDFTYSSCGIANITTADGFKLYITPDASDPLKAGKAEYYSRTLVGSSMREKLNDLTLTYKTGHTVVKDIFGNETTYYFDIMGRTVSVKDREGKVSTTNYNTAGANPKNIHNTVDYSVPQQAIINNLAKNHSFEASNADWTAHVSTLTGLIGGSISYVTGDAQSGSRYLKISDSMGLKHYATQSVAVEVGQTYTLSAYVKIPSPLIYAANGAYLKAEGACSDYIKMSNDWTRYSVTFTAASASATIELGLDGSYNGSVYFDAVQLEKSDVANRYNLLDNPNFDYADGSGYPAPWTRANMAPGDKVQGGRMKAAGSLADSKYLHQTVNVSAKAGETVFFAASAESDTANNQLDEYGRFWGVILVLTYADNTTKNVSVPFIRNVKCPQAASAAFVLPKDCKSIKYCLTYYKQTGNVYFDNAALYVGGSGSVNTYNGNGRLTGVKSGTGGSVEYAYNGALTDIVKVTEKYETNTVSETDFTYDAGHNLTSATTLDGIKTEYFYDVQDPLDASTYGMVTSTKVTGKDGVTKTESSVTYTNDYNYAISRTDARGETVTYSVDTTKGLLMSAADPKGNVRSYTYDPDTDFRLSSSGEMDANNPVATEFEYETWEGDLLKSITRNSTVYAYNYDDFGRVASTQVGSQVLAANSFNAKKYGDTNNNLSRVDYANGDWYEPVYDSLDRLAGRVYNGVEKYRYTYNANNQVGRITDLENGISWTPEYDFAGRMTELAGSDGTSFKVHYDGKGFADSLILAKNGVIQSANMYSYDAVSNLLNEVRLVSMGNGTVGFAYDDLNRVTGTSHTMKSTAQNVKFNTDFSYNQYGSNETSQVGQIDY
ncbi:MAG: DNRLRE domain-containing protein, partial [Oscillospiraceae bacterium]|nr:DNRLRE domain-containing protein [Oscillospiraceae bacterium]